VAAWETNALPLGDTRRNRSPETLGFYLEFNNLTRIYDSQPYLEGPFSVLSIKPMPSKTNIRKDLNLIEFTFSGYMTQEEFRKKGRKLREYAIEHGRMKYLLDASEAVALSRTWPNVLLEPRTWWTLARSCDQVAVFIREEDEPFMQFIEAMSLSVGAKVKVFSDIEGAYKWLGVQ
jgi:signal recognition particle subunit SEC65